MKNLIAFSLLLGVILGGCKKDSNPTDNGTPAQLSITQVSDSISYNLTIPKATFGLTDTLKGSFIVLNQSQSLRVFNFEYQQQIQWTVRSDTDRVVMFQPKLLSPAYSQFQLNPNESKTYSIQQAIKDDAGIPVTAGAYRLSVFLRSSGAPMLTLQISLE